MVDYYLVIAVIGVLFGILQEVRLRRIDAKAFEIADHVSDSAAYIYYHTKHGDLCTQDTIDQLAVKGEEIWIDLEQLGGSVKDMLDEKRVAAKSFKQAVIEESK